MKLELILSIIIAAATTVTAQEVKTKKVSDAQTQSVINDDRGRAFIISGTTEPLLIAPQGKIIAEPQQESVFLGKEWATAAMRERESELANLLPNLRDQTELNALTQRGLKNFFAATFSQEKFVDAKSNHTISDLEIQSLLEAMLRDHSLQPANAGKLYVIFLDSAMRSTLGTMIAGKHYLAYYNFFNFTGVKIQYVVVPFEANQKTAYQIALRAFLAAVLNPGDDNSGKPLR